SPEDTDVSNNIGLPVLSVAQGTVESARATPIPYTAHANSTPQVSNSRRHNADTPTRNRVVLTLEPRDLVSLATAANANTVKNDIANGEQRRVHQSETLAAHAWATAST